jgi:hypothetical protein
MEPLRKIENATCWLCGAAASAWAADGGNAQFTTCKAKNCGDSVLTEAARTRLSGEFSRALSLEAAAASSKGMVLRVWFDYAPSDPKHQHPRQLNHATIPRKNVS